MKTKIPHLVLALSLSLFAAQSASAALVFTFSKGGTPGSTLITVSGDTATAGGSGFAAERDDIGFSQAGTGSFRQTGFSTRETAVSPSFAGLFINIGSGTLSDTISLTSTGITGGSETLINGYQFDANNFYLVMDGLANNGDTLSFAGSSDVTGTMAVDFSNFYPLINQSFYSSTDNFTFYFVPEPSSTALLGLGGLALMLRRKRSAA